MDDGIHYIEYFHLQSPENICISNHLHGCALVISPLIDSFVLRVLKI